MVVGEDENLHNVTQSLIEDFGLQVSEVQPFQSRGYQSEIYTGKIMAGDIVVKIAIKDDRYPSEIWGYKQFRQQNIPVPEILGYQECPLHLQKPTMIMTKAIGSSLEFITLTPKQEEYIYTEAGEILRRVHNIKVLGFGRFIQDGNTFRGKYNSWKEQLEAQWRKNEISSIVEKGFITQEEFDVVDNNFRELVNIDVPQPVYVYEDLHEIHIFTDGEKITDVKYPFHEDIIL